MLRSVLFFLSLTATAAFISCDSDPINCEDKQIGEVFSNPDAKAFFPFNGTEKLIFRDSAGTEITFTCPSPNIRRGQLNVAKLCESIDLSTHHKFVLADYKTLEYKTSDGTRSFKLESSMNSAIVTDNVQDTVLFEQFNALMCANLDGCSELYLLTSTRGNSAKFPAGFEESATRFRAIADTTILGRQFLNLMAGYPVSDTSPTNFVTIYVQAGLGVVAFRDADGKPWVLDRIE